MITREEQAVGETAAQQALRREAHLVLAGQVEERRVGRVAQQAAMELLVLNGTLTVHRVVEVVVEVGMLVTTQAARVTLVRGLRTAAAEAAAAAADEGPQPPIIPVPLVQEKMALSSLRTPLGPW
jgi:hypothetical protein